METVSPERETHILPNGTEVVFRPGPHSYEVGGVELPSVTKIIERFYGNSYESVNPALLKKSADYGTAVHEELQRLIEMRKEAPDFPVFSEFPEVMNYFKLVEPIYGVKPLMTEKVVVLYDAAGAPYAAGRFDLLCEVNGTQTLADFKTTSTIHRRLVTAQLNLYLKAAIQSGYPIDAAGAKLGVIHLKGDTAAFKPMARMGDGFCAQFIW